MAKKVSRFQSFARTRRRCWTSGRWGRWPSFPNWHKFAHFWVLVWKSFTRNRCPVRASALAYVTVLALIPMLAVVVSITSASSRSKAKTRSTSSS